MIIKHSSIKQASTLEHDQIASSNMNVDKLFATAVSGSMDEKQLNQQISLMINAFMQQQGVAQKVSLPSIIERFADCNILDSPICVADYFTYLSDNVIPYANQISSPRCLGHMNQVLPYFVHPLMRLLTAMNQNMTKMEASRVFTACERQTLAKMHRLIYVCAADFYERHVQNNSSTLGIVTSGGTTANLTAMWCARNVALGAKDDFAGVEKEGLMAALQYNGYQGAVIIGSELMHYSFTKAATVMGLGEKGLIRIPTNIKGEMDLDILQQILADCQKKYLKVISIIGLGGSTDCGSIDPLKQIACLAREVNCHFHVDAAWGGPLLFSRQHQTKLEGIELADSVTIDGHKQLYLPLGIGMVIFKHPKLANNIEKEAQYISRPKSFDLGKRSLEGSRPAMAMFLHAAFDIIGRSGYETLVNQSIDKAQQLAAFVKDTSDFELLLEPATNIVLYRYLPLIWRKKHVAGHLSAEDNALINQFNERLNKAQREDGHSYVSRTMISHSAYGYDTPIIAFRAVIANPLTKISDLQAVLLNQSLIAERLDV